MKMTGICYGDSQMEKTIRQRASWEQRRRLVSIPPLPTGAGENPFPRSEQGLEA